MNIIIFVIIVLIWNGSGMIVSDTVLNGLFHPSAIGFLCGVIAIVVSDLLSEVLQ